MKTKEVASFTDAWIETSVNKSTVENLMSHLLQMRGLKPIFVRQDISKGCRIFYRCVD